MNSCVLVQLALTHLQCSQKELAERLGVSPTQISKWKKGEHMSNHMRTKFQVLLKIDDKDPNFVLLAGSLDDAVKWERLIHYLADLAESNAETGYNTTRLIEERDLLCTKTFEVMREMGVTLPSTFPSELDFDYEIDDPQIFGEVLEDNPYSSLIADIFDSLNDVYGFYAAYVYELIWDEELDLYDTAACNIEPHLIHLAASKVDDKDKFTPNFKKFKYRTTKNYGKWLAIVKDKAFRAGVPLRAELLNLAYAPIGELGEEAEAESLGFNASKLHPDVYMNELLEGMRVIHQVLPAILKKLEIDDDFKLDTSQLRIRDR